MNELTPKQEKFAQCVADGKSQADAYRSAYDCKASKPETVQAHASRLMADGKVSARVSEIRATLAAKSLWTRQDSVAALLSIVNDTEVKHNDKTAAVKVLNDMHGYNAPTKSEVKAEIIVGWMKPE